MAEMEQDFNPRRLPDLGSRTTYFHALAALHQVRQRQSAHRTCPDVVTSSKVSAPVRIRTSVALQEARHFTDRSPHFVLETENYPHRVLQIGTDVNRCINVWGPRRPVSSSPRNEFITAGWQAPVAGRILDISVANRLHGARPSESTDYNYGTEGSVRMLVAWTRQPCNRQSVGDTKTVLLGLLL